MALFWLALHFFCLTWYELLLLWKNSSNTLESFMRKFLNFNALHDLSLPFSEAQPLHRYVHKTLLRRWKEAYSVNGSWGRWCANKVQLPRLPRKTQTLWFPKPSKHTWWLLLHYVVGSVLIPDNYYGIWASSRYVLTVTHADWATRVPCPANIKKTPTLQRPPITSVEWKHIWWKRSGSHSSDRASISRRRASKNKWLHFLRYHREIMTSAKTLGTLVCEEKVACTMHDC